MRKLAAVGCLYNGGNAFMGDCTGAQLNSLITTSPFSSSPHSINLPYPGAYSTIFRKFGGLALG
jgi:hypothetical protein